MIYLYLYAVIFWLIVFTIYQKTKSKFSKNVNDYVSNNKGFIALGIVVATMLTIGSPVKLESTSTTGKTSFTQQQQVLTERVEGTPDPLSQDFRKLGEKFKQEAKEKQDEINKNPE
jgi:hypothetical protein